jgi:signal transduction histidine kinase
MDLTPTLEAPALRRGPIPVGLAPVDAPEAGEAHLPPERTPVGRLVTSTAEAAPDDSVHDVSERFFRDPGLEALALTEMGRPVGLVTRSRLLLKLARGFGPELFARKPVCRIADAAPLLVQASTDVVTAIGLALERPPVASYDEVVVVDTEGRYRGLLSVKSLVLHQGLALARSLSEREVARARASDLEGMERLRARFLAHTTHELRSPVSAVVVIAELIRRHAEKEDWRLVSEKVPVLLRMAATLRATVDNILDLSKLEAGREQVDLAPVDLGRILAEVAELARLACHGKPVTVVVEAGPGLSRIVCDGQKLRQILVNLAGNAAKFTERGQVTLGATSGEGELLLRVTDTGIGIRPEDLSRLFTPFTQLEEVATRTQAGSGLGLVIAKAMAQLLGGRIEVASRHGAGSTFTVSIPLRNDEDPLR